MTPEQQRIAIAEACGWIQVNEKNVSLAPKEFRLDSQGEAWTSVALSMPDYLNDLNAMHEAEKVLISRGGLPTYENFLRLNEIKEDNEPWYGSIHATAAQRAEAFLKTLNLWEV